MGGKWKGHAVASFLLIRLLRWSVGLLLILFVTYAMMYYGAGDPIRMMFIQGEDFDTEDEAVMRALRANWMKASTAWMNLSSYNSATISTTWSAAIGDARFDCKSTAPF